MVRAFSGTRSRKLRRRSPSSIHYINGAGDVSENTAYTKLRSMRYGMGGSSVGNLPKTCGGGSTQTCVETSCTNPGHEGVCVSTTKVNYSYGQTMCTGAKCTSFLGCSASCCTTAEPYVCSSSCTRWETASHPETTCTTNCVSSHQETVKVAFQGVMSDGSVCDKRQGCTETHTICDQYENVCTTKDVCTSFCAVPGVVCSQTETTINQGSYQCWSSWDHGFTTWFDSHD